MFPDTSSKSLPCALVLGASGSLGSAVARTFLQHGYRVLGTGFRRRPAVQVSLQVDIMQAADRKKLVAWIREQTERMDVVIHCIGLTRDGLLTRMNDSDWQEVIDINLKSAYLLSKEMLPVLVKQESSHLIFVGSWTGRIGRLGQANYAAAKAGLIGLVQSLAREYASRGVQANCIVPGVFRSPMTENLSSEQLERLWGGAALKKWADLDETSRFIVHLASMRGVTGQVFQLDGRIPPA